MKPFNLEEALNGKAFVLRNGYRGVIKYAVDDMVKADNSTPRCGYVGYILTNEGFLHTPASEWDDKGRNGVFKSLDAIGMYEEPSKSQDKILEEAWENKGKVAKIDAGMTTVVQVIGKTSDGEYIVRNPVDGLLAEISVYGKLNWRTYEEPKGPVLNHNLAILHLPKPITPKALENYWYIDRAEGKLLVSSTIYSNTFGLDIKRCRQGNCFASESDAQAWINALDYARTGKVTIV
nr:MAG TPA: hypothetical protein [Caudoviricetes sp.]